MPELLTTLKRAALDAVENAKPCAMAYGQVVSAEPLSIKVDQRMTLTAGFLILTNAVKDHEVEVELQWETNRDAQLETRHSHPMVSEGSFDSAHAHGLTGKKKLLVKNGLKAGERVLLLRVENGQRYIVWYRI